VLERGQRIRVDKRKGKLVEIGVKLPTAEALEGIVEQPSDFIRRLEVRVELIDATVTRNHIQTNSSSFGKMETSPEVQLGPSIIPSETSEEHIFFGSSYQLLQLRMRITTISRKQLFQVSLIDNSTNCSNSTCDHIICTKQSIEFSSDDNGRPYDPFYSPSPYSHSTSSHSLDHLHRRKQAHKIASGHSGIKIEKGKKSYLFNQNTNM